MKKQIIQLAILAAVISTGNTAPFFHSAVLSMYALNKSLQQHKEAGIEKSPFVTIEKIKKAQLTPSEKSSNCASSQEAPVVVSNPTNQADDTYLSEYKITGNTRPYHKMSEYSFNGPELAYYASIFTGAHCIKKMYTMFSSAPKTSVRTFVRKNVTFAVCAGLFTKYETVNKNLNWEENCNKFVRQERERIEKNRENLNKK